MSRHLGEAGNTWQIEPTSTEILAEQRRRTRRGLREDIEFLAGLLARAVRRPVRRVVRLVRGRS